jgi:hypothetical protein
MTSFLAKLGDILPQAMAQLNELLSKGIQFSCRHWKPQISFRSRDPFTHTVVRFGCTENEQLLCRWSLCIPLLDFGPPERLKCSPENL